MARKVKGFWTLDCETDPFSRARSLKNEIPKPFAWGAYHHPSGDYHEFSNMADVAAFFSDARALVYAHNGGKFDYHYLREYLNTDEPILVIGGRLAKFRIGNSEFRDSLNLLPVALAQFGGKSEIDYSKFEPEVRAQHMPEILAYQRQDCISLADNLARFFTTYGRSITQASASMKYWSKKYEIAVPHQNKGSFDLYRPFYHGGRVQCFTDGVKSVDFSVFDINSAYPHAMLDRHAFSPTAVRRTHLPPEDQLYRTLIRLRCTARGCFPWSNEEGETFYPEDEREIREYCVTGYEFSMALELGAIRNIHIIDVHYFTETISFKDYIEFFYEERQKAKREGDKAGDIFCKIFMNALYGRFGIDPDNHAEYVISYDDTVQKWLEQGFIDYKRWSDGKRFLVRPIKTLPADSTKRRYVNVATAASITGYVRAGLYKTLHRSSGLIYCDTDSLASKSLDADKGLKLGQWKNEMDCDQYAIAGKKLYAFRNKLNGEYKVACKGVKMSASEIINVANGGTFKYIPEVPTYSLTREEPCYINRIVKKTYKNISVVN